MMHIKFKYKYDEYNKEYVLTSKIFYNDCELYIWDTTTEETYTLAMRLANINVSVDWDLDEEDEEDDDETISESPLN